MRSMPRGCRCVFATREPSSIGTYDKVDPFTVVGRWNAARLGEWGLRFWVNLCVSAEDGSPVTFDAETGAATVKVGTRFVALVSTKPGPGDGSCDGRGRGRGLRAPRLLPPGGPRHGGARAGAALQPRDGARQPLRRRGRGSAKTWRSRKPVRRCGRGHAGLASADRRLRGRARCHPRRHGLEHGVGRRQCPALYVDQPQLERGQVRRLRGLARRPALRGPADRPLRSGGGAREPRLRLGQRDAAGQPRLPGHGRRRLGGPHPDPGRRLRGAAARPAQRLAGPRAARLSTPSPATTPGGGRTATRMAGGSVPTARRTSAKASTRARPSGRATNPRWTMRRSTTRPPTIPRPARWRASTSG